MESHVSATQAARNLSDLINHVYVKVTNGNNPATVVSALNAAFASHGLHDHVAFDYKTWFINKLANVGVLQIRKDASFTDDQVIANVRAWYLARGYQWDAGSVRTPATMENIDFAGPVINIFFTIVMFSLIISTIGLAATVYSSVQSRTRSYGTMKAIGFDDTTVRRMVFMESFMVSFIGAIFGIISAIFSTWMIFDGLSSSMFMPIYFEVPWLLIGLVAAFLALVTIASSQIIAIAVSRRTVVESIRYRE